MKRRGLFVLFLAFFLAGVGRVAAQAPVNIEFDTIDQDASPQVSDAGFPRLNLTLTPMSDTGVPINGLSAADFAVTVDGAPVRDFTVSERIDPAQGISVMLVLDVSGSMRDDIDELRAAAAALLDRMIEQTDETAIITFATLEDGTTVDLRDSFPRLTQGREVDFTNDEGRLKNLINGIVINENDGTPLYDAIYKGARMARENAANTRRVVIVMTDGVDSDRQGNRDQGSLVYDRNGLLEELRLLNVPVFTVGLGDDIDSAFLQRVANTTGGTYQNAAEASDLAAIFIDVARRLKVKYDLELQANTRSDDQLHNLEVSARTPLGTGSSTARFQARYPIVPWVQGVQAANPRQDFRSLDTFESVKGRVTLRPQIVARGNIAKVDYFVDDQLVYTADASPWEFSWNTTELTAGETHRLLIEATNDAEPASVGRLEYAIPVEACSVICQIEEGTGIPATYFLAGLLALLLLFVLLLVLMRRRREPEPVYQSPYYPMPPVATPPAPPPATPLQPTIGAEPLPETVAPGGSRPAAKTEVLKRRKGPIAYLIDNETGRQFQLDEVTSIGRDAQNDIILDEAAVGRQHAKIRQEEGAFAVVDLGSTNGTRVNGATIARHVLVDGDRIEIGRKTLTFRIVE